MHPSSRLICSCLLLLRGVTPLPETSEAAIDRSISSDALGPSGLNLEDLSSHLIKRTRQSPSSNVPRGSATNIEHTIPSNELSGTIANLPRQLPDPHSSSADQTRPSKSYSNASLMASPFASFANWTYEANGKNYTIQLDVTGMRWTDEITTFDFLGGSLETPSPYNVSLGEMYAAYAKQDNASRAKNVTTGVQQTLALVQELLKEIVDLVPNKTVARRALEPSEPSLPSSSVAPEGAVASAPASSQEQTSARLHALLAAYSPLRDVTHFRVFAQPSGIWLALAIWQSQGILNILSPEMGGQLLPYPVLRICLAVFLVFMSALQAYRFRDAVGRHVMLAVATRLFMSLVLSTCLAIRFILRSGEFHSLDRALTSLADRAGNVIATDLDAEIQQILARMHLATTGVAAREVSSRQRGQAYSEALFNSLLATPDGRSLIGRQIRGAGMSLDFPSQDTISAVFPEEGRNPRQGLAPGAQEEPADDESESGSSTGSNSRA